MPVDTWFPLAVYYTDLEGAGQHNPAMRAAILALEQAAGEHRFAGMAWTGDVHGIGQLHADPRFAWLVQQVEQHCLEYLRQLGHNMTILELYIQRSWPVISRTDQRVGAHAHHTANISAAYYVSVPDVEDRSLAGNFVLHNMAEQNELQQGMATPGTNAVAHWNALNCKQVFYQPLPGRLLLFPSRQSHSVEPNQTAQERISVSFDIIMAARRGMGRETPEFLPPPPDQWQPFGAASD
ncbi:MAG: hypothetical protein KDI44_00865 [Thiothrix sp.]|nr:hypothetical protein [Thiothrix sp.]HPQ94945.1 TIGR02466 family protein [Thiolinea sp.]